MVRTGTDRTFSFANGGRRRTGGIGLLGESRARYSTSAKKAEAASDAYGFDVDRWALAEVWRQFNVTGPRRRYARLECRGNWRTAWSAGGAASSSLRLRLFLVDITADRVVDQFTLLNEGGQIVDFNQNNRSYRRDVSGYLRPGRTYRVGCRAETWATGVGFGTATADVHGSGHFNGYLRWDQIRLDWI